MKTYSEMTEVERIQYRISQNAQSDIAIAERQKQKELQSVQQQRRNDELKRERALFKRRFARLSNDEKVQLISQAIEALR